MFRQRKSSRDLNLKKNFENHSKNLLVSGNLRVCHLKTTNIQGNKHNLIKKDFLLSYPLSNQS